MKLPNSQDLNSEQMEILFSGLENDLFVSGPPGTGKTVMALYRAQMISEKDENNKFWIIMYNRVLSKYTRDNLGSAGFKQADKVEKRIRTMHQWAYAWGKNWGWGIPEIERYIYDWKEAMKRLMMKDPEKRKRAANWQHLIIDEGQDFPKEFYSILAFTKSIGSDIGKDMALTVFADENQKITKYNSSVAEIEAELRPDNQHNKALTKNYRNSLQIAKLASTFYVGADTGIPDFPNRTGLEDPKLFPCKSMREEVNKIVNFMKMNDDLTVGVFVQTHMVRRPLYNELLKADFGGSDIKIQTFVSEDENHTAEKLEIERQGSITVVCAASCKGLEFDAVFIPRLETYPMDPGAIREFKMGMYVQISRARDYLYFSYSSSTGQKPGILKYFPAELQGESSDVWIDQPALNKPITSPITPEHPPNTADTTPPKVIGRLEVIKYKKAILLKGDTKPIKDEIKNIGGKWNGKLGGWIFPGSKENEVISFAQKYNK